MKKRTMLCLPLTLAILCSLLTACGSGTALETAATPEEFVTAEASIPVTSIALRSSRSAYGVFLNRNRPNQCAWYFVYFS